MKHTHESSPSAGDWMQNILDSLRPTYDPLESMTGQDFVRYHILIDVYDGVNRSQHTLAS